MFFFFNHVLSFIKQKMLHLLSGILNFNSYNFGDLESCCWLGRTNGEGTVEKFRVCTNGDDSL